MSARILAVVDSYDAMTSDRPYRKAMSASEAREELLRCTGRQYDPLVVEAFLHVQDEEEHAAISPLSVEKTDVHLLASAAQEEHKIGQA